MDTLLIPSGTVSAASTCEVSASARILPGLTATEPQRRFADAPPLARMAEERKAASRKPAKESAAESAASKTASGSAGKAACKGAHSSTPNDHHALGMLAAGFAGVPQAPAPDVGKPPGAASVAPVRKGLTRPDSPVARTVAERGRVPHLQRLHLLHVPPAGASHVVEGVQPIGDKGVGKPNPDVAIHGMKAPLAKAESIKTSGPVSKTDGILRADLAVPGMETPRNAAAESVKALGVMPKTDRVLPKLQGAGSEKVAHPAKQVAPKISAEPGTTPNRGRADSVGEVREKGPAEKVTEARRGSPDLSGVPAGQPRPRTAVPDQVQEPMAKAAPETKQAPIAQVANASQHNSQESRKGGREAAVRHQAGTLAGERADGAPMAAKKPLVNAAREELHGRSELQAPSSEPANAAPRPITPDLGSLDRPVPKGPAQSVGEQILDSVHASVVRGGKELLVRLQPPELGTVLIRFRQQGGEIGGVVEVSRIDTRREIEHALPQVLRGLQEAGVQIKRLDVVAHEQPERDSGRGSLQQEGSMHQPHQGHGSGQMREQAPSSWEARWGAGRQDGASTAEDSSSGEPAQVAARGRIDMLL